MYHDVPRAGLVAVFPQVDTLPCAQHQRTLLEGDAYLGGSKR